MLIWILKITASLFACLMAFCAVTLLFFTFLLTAAIEHQQYTDALAQQQVYDRLYFEVLTPQLVSEIRPIILPDLDWYTPEELVKIVRDVAPPEYLHGQAENNLLRLSAYFGGDTDRLELYLDVSEPLQRWESAHQKLNETDATVDPALTLQETGVELRGNVRVDLMPILARIRTGASESHFRQTLEEWRNYLQTAIVGCRALALALFVAALVLLVLAHWRTPASIMAWAGWAVMVSGGIWLAATLLALWQLPGMGERAAYQALLTTLPRSPELASVGADVAGQTLSNLLGSLLWPAVMPAAAGGLALSGLFTWRWWRNRPSKQEPETPGD